MDWEQAIPVPSEFRELRPVMVKFWSAWRPSGRVVVKQPSPPSSSLTSTKTPPPRETVTVASGVPVTQMVALSPWHTRTGFRASLNSASSSGTMSKATSTGVPGQGWQAGVKEKLEMTAVALLSCSLPNGPKLKRLSVSTKASSSPSRTVVVKVPEPVVFRSTNSISPSTPMIKTSRMREKVNGKIVITKEF